MKVVIMSYLLELARLHIALTQILTQNTNYTVYNVYVHSMRFGLQYLLFIKKDGRTYDMFLLFSASILFRLNTLQKKNL